MFSLYPRVVIVFSILGSWCVVVEYSFIVNSMKLSALWTSNDIFQEFGWLTKIVTCCESRLFYPKCVDSWTVYCKSGLTFTGWLIYYLIYDRTGLHICTSSHTKSCEKVDIFTGNKWQECCINYNKNLWLQSYFNITYTLQKIMQTMYVSMKLISAMLLCDLDT